MDEEVECRDDVPKWLQFPNGAPREYVTDERLTFAGTLKLNADDIYQMNYIIKEAHEYTP